MNIDIMYRAPGKRKATNISRDIPYHVFLKHLAFAGMGFSPSYMQFIRTLGGLGWFYYYLDQTEFNMSKFSVPPVLYHDVTEQGQFSNVVGLAIADFLAKDLNDAFVTLRYEGCMKFLGAHLNTSRPDLLGIRINNNCSNNNINSYNLWKSYETIAIEAKGSKDSTVSAARMRTYKKAGKSRCY